MAKRGIQVSAELAAQYGMKAQKSIPPSERYISPNAAGRILSVTGEAVKQWIYHGRLPAAKLSNGYWKIKVADLETFLRTMEGEQRRRILLFDKPSASHTELVSCLEKDGREAVVAQNASDALLKAADRYPALFVVNVSIAGGWDLTKKIRKTRNIKTLPILIISDKPLSETENDQALEVGAQGALVRPAAKEIVEEIERILSRVL